MGLEGSDQKPSSYVWLMTVESAEKPLSCCWTRQIAHNPGDLTHQRLLLPLGGTTFWLQTFRFISFDFCEIRTKNRLKQIFALTGILGKMPSAPGTNGVAEELSPPPNSKRSNCFFACSRFFSFLSYVCSQEDKFLTRGE